MDCLLEFSQRSTENSQDFYPPINLKPELNHVLGLYSLSTYNSSTNITQGVNVIIFQKTKKSANEDGSFSSLFLAIPSGSYEITTLANYIEAEALHKGIEFHLLICSL